MAVKKEFFMATDNLVQLTGLRDAGGDYINDATVKMSLFKDDTLNPEGGGPTSEVQTLTLDAKATAGTFTLTYKGETTTDLAYNAALSTIKTALEVLSTVEVDDITVGGDTLDTENGEMTFTFANTLGDVSMLVIDIDSLTGPSESTIVETTKGAGAVTDEADGKVGIPATEHELSADDYIRIEGTDNYDGEYEIDSVETNKIIIVATYVAETLSGSEVIYIGIPNGTNISVSYVAASDGNYEGILPDTLKGIVERDWYYLFVEAIKDTSRLTSRLKWKAVYHLSTD